MYVIVIYDLEAERTHLLRKPLREYLTHVQNSVFEGRVSEAEADNIEAKVEEVVAAGESGIVYRFRSGKYVDRKSFGADPADENQFL